MGNDVFRKPPLGRIPYESTNFLDKDSAKKNQPGEVPIESGYRGKEPEKFIDKSRKTVGVQMLARDRYAALRITRTFKGKIAIRFSKPFNLIDGNPILQLFINGPFNVVNLVVSQLDSANIAIRHFDVAGPGGVRGPNIYRDKSVRRRGR